MVCHSIIHALNKLAPRLRLLSLLFISIVVIIVIAVKGVLEVFIFIDGDKVADEVLSFIAKQVLKRIARPRIFKLHHGHNEVRNINRLCAAIYDLPVGRLNELGHLCRQLGLHLNAIGQGRCVAKMALNVVFQQLNRSIDADNGAESAVFKHSEKKMLRHNELMSERLAMVGSLVDKGFCSWCIVYICHS